jgi:hypothetical protein
MEMTVGEWGYGAELLLIWIRIPRRPIKCSPAAPIPKSGYKPNQLPCSHKRSNQTNRRKEKGYFSAPFLGFYAGTNKLTTC